MNHNHLLSNPIAGAMRWGSWGANFSTQDFNFLINTCVEKGISSFDHADIYGHYTTEEDFGKALKMQPGLRQQIQIITKTGIQMPSPNKPDYIIKSYNYSTKHIIQSVENSLQHFGTDYLDVLLLHRPSPLLNPNEVAQAIQTLKQHGKILTFGVSNFLPHQVNALQPLIPIQYNQIEISIIELSAFTNGVLDNCLQHNIQPMAWAPLGGGLLSDEEHPRFRNIHATVKELAEKYETGLNEILITFLLKHPAKIIPVLGTTKVERLVQAQKAVDIQLDTQDWFKIWVAATGKEVD